MPHSKDFVQKVVQRLQAGDAVDAIAQDLRVSDSWVRTVQARLRSGGDGNATGQVGGARRHLCTADNLRRLVAILQKHPKMTLQELAARGRELRLFNVPRGKDIATYMPHPATLSRLLSSVGLSFQAAQYYDPAHVAAAGQEEPTAQQRFNAIAMAERIDLQRQQRDPTNVLSDRSRLMFMDESTFMLTEQARRAWGSKNDPPKLPKRKGLYQSYTLMLTIAPGVPPDPSKRAFVVAHIRNPEAMKEFPFVQPGDKRVADPDLPAVVNAALRPSSTDAELREELLRLGLSDKEVQTENDVVVVKTALDAKGMWKRLQTAKTKNKVGLPIADHLVAVAAGKPKARIDAAQVATYLADNVRSAWTGFFRNNRDQAAVDLKNRCLVWDNAVYHMAARANSTQTVSWWHSHIQALTGIGNTVFLPAKAPGTNPCETAFAYIKREVRKRCPESGQFAPEELKAAIDAAVAKITPQMIDAWVKACGFGRDARPRHDLAERKEPAPVVEGPTRGVNPCDRDDEAEQARRRRHPVACAAPDGRVVRVRPANSLRWRQLSAEPEPGVPLRDVAGAVQREVKEARQAARNREVADALAPPAERRWVGPSAGPAPEGRKPVNLRTGRPRPTYLAAREALLMRLNLQRQKEGAPPLTMAELERKAGAVRWQAMPRVVEAERDVYTVERILAVRQRPDRTWEAHLKWAGFDEAESTWEPFTNLSDAWLREAQKMQRRMRP
jgi:transposase